MHTEKYYLDQIRSDPKSSENQLEYCRWLDSQGNPRGRYGILKHQLQLGEMSTEERTSRKSEVSEIYTLHSHEWEQPALDLGASSVGAGSGFIDSITVPAECLIENSAEFERITPAGRDLTIHNPIDHADALAKLSVVTNARSISMSHSVRMPCQPVNDLFLEKLFSGNTFPNLWKLRLEHNKITQRGLIHLLSQSDLPSLKFLTLYDNEIGELSPGEWGGITISVTPHHMNLGSNQFGACFVDQLVNSVLPDRLQNLNLGGSHVDDFCYESIANSDKLHNLQTLVPPGLSVSDRGLQNLSRSTSLVNLKSLNLF